MNPIINYKKTINLIQKVRLIQALAESDYQVNITPTDYAKFSVLLSKFDFSLLCDENNGFDVSPYITFAHNEPQTTIGNINRSLIFPEAIAKYCRSLWEKKRCYHFTFAGLITPERKDLITHWIETEMGQKTFHLPDGNDLASKIKRRLKMDDTQVKQIGELTIWFSRKGRKFPVKAWDEAYFRALASSQFVLCPNGDFVWSYRFFESILCGAIPMIQDDCPAYAGFRYLRFSDSAAGKVWSSEDAEYNYRLCVERITVPRTALNAELKRITGS